MTIALIAAMARGRVIGHGGELPWLFREDLRRFRKLTMGKPVIMGRTTFESIGCPLDGRTNIVLTRQRERPSSLHAPGVLASLTPELALIDARRALQKLGASEIMVIGGEQVYHAFLRHATRLYLTQIDATFEGDAYFPDIGPSEWRVSGSPDWRRDPESGLNHRFLVFDRREPVPAHLHASTH